MAAPPSRSTTIKPYLKIADVVIGSVALDATGARPDDFEAVMRERRYRPMFLIDMGVPRNFDERLNALENVYLYDIDDLGAVVHRSLGDREREADKAEADRRARARLVPALARRARPDADDQGHPLQYRALARRRTGPRIADGWPRLEPAERERVELLTRGLTNKLLHRILSGLRSNGADSPDAAYAAEVARRLLGAEFDAAGRRRSTTPTYDNDDSTRTST